MIQHTDIDNFSARKPVVTVGIFDGVHRGHRFILERLRETADRLGGESVLISLWPHPRMVLNQVDDSFSLLLTIDEKKQMLENERLDHLVILPFTESLSRLSSSDFIKEYLVEKINIHHLVVGFNHRFGRNREGDFTKLKDYAKQFGFGIEQVPQLEPDNEEISSSRIRQYLLEGDVSMANKLLGWEYTFSGEVVGGSKLGTYIGFPTANITPAEKFKLIPADGVYAVRASLHGDSYLGMLNIGSRPTVNDDPDQKTIEVHLLNFEKNIYNEQIQVQFVKRLREERKFKDIESLRKQLLLDKENTLRLS
ncbi:bifunctional riboflavin kinase/FAD synthetase [Bacteroidota bacterium]